MSFFLVSENHEYVYRLINSLAEISLLTPLFIEKYNINILIGIIIILVEVGPYIIILYRRIKSNSRNMKNISKNILQVSITS